MNRQLDALSKKGKLHILVPVILILAMSAILFPGCAGDTYTQTIKITAEPINVNGLVAKIEYHRDRELVNSMHFIDGNGDGVIDGKAGHPEDGIWPKGWEWFNDMYKDVTVGYSTIVVVGEKLKIQNGTTYEFLTGEYECEQIG
ncbi:MAG: hypothetical protein J7L19_01900 [Dehalococcoidia bacterium]|nr:hypothetical protein [Dehalococcoidia bacterium]